MAAARLFSDEEVSGTAWSADHLQAPGQQWPRRLLEVSSMTSFERQETAGIACYGSQSSPTYNILTYTWGRWMSDQGENVCVRNISWETPRILPAHFSSKQLETALRCVAGNGAFVWIDIACIDQADGLVKGDEIGRQAGIFEKADQVFVWLTTIPALELQELLNRLAEQHKFCENLANLKDFPSDGQLEAWASSANDSCSKLLSDPWFSSLWTLQEAYLRHDGIILSQEALSAQWPLSQFKRKALLKDLIWCFHTMLSAWEQLLARRILHGSQLHSQVGQLVQRVLESGLPTLHDGNPVSVYGVACFRRPLETLDRVEGIQQIFGLSLVGHGIQDLDTLQTQLALKLNSKSPLYAQLFVHMQSAPEGLSWRLGQHARVPEAARWATGRYTTALRGKLPADNLCRISQVNDQVMFEGFRCKTRLIRILKSLSAPYNLCISTHPLRCLRHCTNLF
ncbi:hypothetical protein BDV96DRAFT_593249 [Lophiotrema nucula]|uniref:Heterokaryon incompatibility domain-containing protein n=1 Tax=Lophiotrema nucula TaxID=690887 RepID=A0A6A5ZTC7_9PLEO|nr:hypothetical protein BDV96DRAFT_593249 [Lophiotrema nucula]